MIKKAVITAAGRGTRLLPFTKELPKEMLPLFVKNNGQIFTAPVAQIVFESLHDFGIDQFCFIVGRGKRAMQDHFTPHDSLMNILRKNGNENTLKGFEDFHSRLENSEIFWKDQINPRGFGHSVLMAKSFVGDEPFLVHAGDTYIISSNNNCFHKLADVFERKDAAAAIIVDRVRNAKQYGVIRGKEIEDGIYRVDELLEKPKNPPSNLAISAVYIFNPIIFKALEEIPAGHNNEIQLTDAIQRLVKMGEKVYAVELEDGKEFWLDIGKPFTYMKAFETSYRMVSL